MFNVPKDKLLHFLVSLFGVVGITWALKIADIKGILVVFFVMLVIGFGKEIADYFNPKKRKFDKYDLLADTVGATVGLCLVCLQFIK